MFEIRKDNMIHKIYVEKKKGFDVAAERLAAQIKSLLDIDTKVRILNRYSFKGSKVDFKNAKGIVFSEPPADRTYYTLPKTTGRVLIVELLPGQYDQRADSAAACVQMLSLGERPVITCAACYIFEPYDADKQMTDEEFSRIKKLLINPVESREAGDLAEDSASAETVINPEPKADGFINMTAGQLKSFLKAESFGFSYKDLSFIQEFFKKEGRDPYLAELKILDTYWSDHCRHTTFNTELTDIKIDSDIPEIAESLAEYEQLFTKHYKEGKYKSLMSLATIGAKELEARGAAPNLDKSKEINACSIKVKADLTDITTGQTRQEDWTVMFKNETHNHPTEIEPFGGAATCLGGAIRDPLSGRVYVYQSMRVSGAGDIKQDFKDTVKGKLPQRVISTTAAHGFSSYGNQIGLATGHVREVFDEGYAAKRMEVGFVVGAAPSANIVREEPAAGDIVLLIGGATGRDGCGGATGSSKAHNEDSVARAGAEVQKGNPVIERKLQRLFRNGEFAKLIKRCNDFGAGGVSVAVGELADSVDINLDAVPVKQAGLSGLELAISESQERMAVVIDPSDKDRIYELCAMENLAAAEVAAVTDSNRMRMYFKGELIVDLCRDFLNTNGVKGEAAAVITDSSADYLNTLRHDEDALFEGGDYTGLTNKLLASPAVSSQKGMVEMFDSTIGAGTVLMPFGGRRQMTPALSMAAKLPVEAAGVTTSTVTVSSFGFNPALSKISPYKGAAYAVLLSVIKAAVTGADYDSIYLSFQEYFEKLTTPEKWGKPTAALLGALSAQTALSKAAIGGKDSMSGSFEDLHVPPTLISFALGIANCAQIITNTASNSGTAVYRFKLRRSQSGMPDYYSTVKFLKAFGKLSANIDFAAVVEEGGAVCALAKSLFGEGFGFRFACPVTKDLFTPLLGDIIFGVKESENSPQTQMFINGFGCEHLGDVTAHPYMIFHNDGAPVSVLESAFAGTMESIYPTFTAEAKTGTRKFSYRGGNVISNTIKTAAPRVFIPVFPGTNCEVDTARAFEAAGAKTDIFVIKNLTAKDMSESVAEIRRRIEKSNIIAFPGGFSAGDEPDGSGKFIAATFLSPVLTEAVHELLYTRDGLILGICNGFQALIKLGLLPYGKIAPLTADSPTLTFNKIGRHISSIADVRVASNLSPWLSGVKVGEVFKQPVSHGEGRFFASAAHIKRLAEGGQIATQYVNPEGKPTLQSPYNPNGSVLAAEGITSPDGRVFGKMGHSERIGDGLYKNIPGSWDMRIFASGVKYFL